MLLEQSTHTKYVSEINIPMQFDHILVWWLDITIVISSYSLISVRCYFSSLKISISHLNKWINPLGINSSKPPTDRCYGDHHYPISNPWTTCLSFVPKFKSILSCKITLETTKSRPPIWKKRLLQYIIQFNTNDQS